MKTKQASPVHQRLRRGVGTCAIKILYRQELTSAQLHARLQGFFPDDVIDPYQVIESLTARHLIEQDGVFYGLTARGAAAAELLAEDGPEDHAAAPSPSATELDNRMQLVGREDHMALLTRSPRRAATSAADVAPAPVRPGALASLSIPSRFGDRLHYRDGRVTDMAGNPIHPAKF